MADADDRLAVRNVETDDCSWVAGLADDSRRRYAAFSPRFWNPADGADETHLAFLMWLVLQDDTVAVRTDNAFAIGMIQGTRLMVDDFTVDDPALWATHGRALLTVLRDEAAQRTSIEQLRVVTARADEPKRAMLAAIGLEPGSRWWIAELDGGGAGGSGSNGNHRVADHDVVLLDAPPVYAPGGPVAMVDNPSTSALNELAAGAADLGAVLLIAAVELDDPTAPAIEAALDDAGFHNASEFWDGLPA